MEEINLRDIVNILKKRFWIIALTVSVLVVFSILLSIFILKTEYKSTTTLIINEVKNYKDNEDFIGIVTNEQLIRTLKEIMKSSLIIGKVRDNLNLEDSLIKIDNQTVVSIIQNTGVMKIEVKNKDPIISRDIANEIAEVFIEYVHNNSETLRVKIINEAQIPKTPNTPNLKLNIAIGILVGLIIGVLLIYCLEYFDDTLKKSKDIEQKVQLPVIGKIPKLPPGNSENIDTSVDESFRLLRTYILTLTKNGIRSILVTSADPLEGKSTIVSNIAISMAQNGQKVLLIDCNMRKPSIHKLFNISKYKGLSNELKDYTSSYIKFTQSTKVENLYIMSGGSICLNPSEALGSDFMKRLLIEAENDYDIVLLDSPPIGVVADAAVLATITDGTILVCAYKETKIDNLKDCKIILDKLNTNILGVILNKHN
ncbi:polysaccharide biosynthesis tyrosine autokinase [Clostridium sp. D2Q-11]|uniref:Polysaccharide biosynthesis tyrosine autokinase n=1 Tax=Anaeromonas frigoriresistens TaxID=2683708 RepID=A0A942V2K9_9FIRM|nr:polysaccharide biosynthesis tyrosine autokinase [Anaeromonas frigoriresistens]MBS4538817.1 polysaccharide biosynthesis tyrosine autokinase [Anaeromonas frigoriresistens]